MASITVAGHLVEVRFSAWERLWIGRERLTIPLAAVRHASMAAEPVRLARGARRGIAISGLLKIGVWGLFGGTRQIVAARRGEPGVHLLLDRAAAGTGADFDEVVLSVPDGAAIIRATAART